MKLIIRNKWFSPFKPSSYVRDETDTKDLYQIEGRFWTLTSKKFVKDLNGDVKYMVRNKFWKIFIHRAFVFDAEGNKICTVRRKFWSLHDRYFVEECSLGNMEIMGNILQFDYNITLDGKQIGHIMRKISLRDSFVLDASDEYEPEFLVALVIAIDNITDRKGAEGSSISFGSGD